MSPLPRRILRRVSQRLAATHNADHYNTVDMPKLFFYYSRKKIFDAAFIISLLKRSVIIMSKINSCGNDVIKMYKKTGIIVCKNSCGNEVVKLYKKNGYDCL